MGGFPNLFNGIWKKIALYLMDEITNFKFKNLKLY